MENKKATTAIVASIHKIFITMQTQKSENKDKKFFSDLKKLLEKAFTLCISNQPNIISSILEFEKKYRSRINPDLRDHLIELYKLTIGVAK